MVSFLEEVARRLYGEYGESISDLKILFPSRRARLFFVDALSRIVKHPLWQPKWVTIDELMSSVVSIEQGDRVRLIAELYKIYSQYHNESFDRFYFWGEILLSDFDMIDKYRVNADMLFRNVSDIKELEADVSYLTPEQLKIIAFWNSLGEESDLSEEKRRFLHIWRSLSPIYHKYREALCELGIAYTGMIHRLAVESIEAGEWGELRLEGDEHYVTVGFNALSECESQLFRSLERACKVDFFWDYDIYYTQNSEQEAGLFVRKNIKDFAPAYSLECDNMSKPKHLEVVTAASNALQCKYVTTILEQIQASGQKIDKNTAIVLTDETLLMPLLYSLPQDIGRVNVTMGYALRETLAYTFVERLIELQHHAREARGGSDVTFYHVDVVGLLSHPYILNEHTGGVINKILCDIEKLRMISVSASTLRGLPLLELIFKRHNSWSAISQYLQDVVGVVVQNLVSDLTVEEEHLEYLDFISSHILTLENSVEACGIELSVEIYISLLRRHLQTLRIPFEGEPLEGLQVMGILESRNLDFRNVIILSMNDDNFPTNQLSKPSFIPYNLRLAYSLPTPEHHEGVYAYYFYRLISRAQSVWMLYSSHAGEMSTGEPSRYIHQLEYESTFPISRVAVGVDVNMVANETIEVEKSGRVAEQLSRFLDVDSPVTLSPTALFRYIACPLRFYLYSLAGVRRDEQISEEVDAPMFGTIFHAAIEKLYEPYVNIVGVGEALKELVSKGSVEEAVECAINDHYLKKECAKLADYSGNLLLVKEIVTKYIKGGVIAYDVANPQFVVRGVECDINDDYEFELGRRVRFKGVIDRLDSLDSGELRVVDYKTGGQHLEFKGIESLFKGAAEQRQSHIIQTLIYSMLLARREPERVIAPALYYVRSMNREGYSPRIVDCSVKPHEELLDYATCGEEFESYMREVLCELFDTSVPFRQCEDREKTCIYCDYASICRGVD